ncbi:hypothetical protein IGB42_01331 [Andreprevotia sp. IGB-42]|uniref:hypothetical protein n=1 Tax=Andreprevotia sp. IGB-42 TaxID=2497473 RepID=UPI001359158C|nr:hypothetical protein [Andreprevotia sp. IGB-42]KAF0814430.1 hypothetical protein IGB42_01331 [Andreprevotia sp. IGB-42]
MPLRHDPASANLGLQPCRIMDDSTDPATIVGYTIVDTEGPLIPYRNYDSEAEALLAIDAEGKEPARSDDGSAEDDEGLAEEDALAEEAELREEDVLAEEAALALEDGLDDEERYLNPRS